MEFILLHHYFLENVGDKNRTFCKRFQTISNDLSNDFYRKETMMKRANGSGSVYKRKDARRRNPFVAVINLGFDNEGKRKKKIIGSFATFHEAQKALEIYNNTPMETKKAMKITLGELWKMHCLQQEKIGKPINVTLRSTYRTHVIKIADMPISEIRTVHLQSVIDESNTGHMGQSKIVTVFHAIYKIALANDIALKDYSRFLKIKEFVKSTIHKPFTEKEMQTMWKNKTDLLTKIILIQCYTGTRSADLCRMLLKNVNLSEQYMIGGSKTEAGRNRLIPIANCILPIVREFYEKSKLKKSPYLFTLEKDMPRNKDRPYFPRIYKTVYGNKHLAHDARHTFITLAANYELNDIDIKLIVGHKQTDITKDVYTHRLREQLLSTVNKLPYGIDMKMDPRESGSHVVATE